MLAYLGQNQRLREFLDTHRADFERAYKEVLGSHYEAAKRAEEELLEPESFSSPTGEEMWFAIFTYPNTNRMHPGNTLYTTPVMSVEGSVHKDVKKDAWEYISVYNSFLQYALQEHPIGTLEPLVHVAAHEGITWEQFKRLSVAGMFASELSLGAAKRVRHEVWTGSGFVPMKSYRISNFVDIPELQGPKLFDALVNWRKYSKSRVPQSEVLERIMDKTKIEKHSSSKFKIIQTGLGRMAEPPPASNSNVN